MGGNRTLNVAVSYSGVQSPAALAAERIYGSYALERSISVAALKPTPKKANLTSFTPSMPTRNSGSVAARSADRIELSPVAVSQFLYAHQSCWNDWDKSLKPDPVNRVSMPSALVLAAADPRA